MIARTGGDASLSGLRRAGAAWRPCQGQESRRAGVASRRGVEEDLPVGTVAALLRAGPPSDGGYVPPGEGVAGAVAGQRVFEKAGSDPIHRVFGPEFWVLARSRTA